MTGAQDRPTAPSRVRVRRTGGIAGRTLEGEIDLSAEDDRAVAAREILERLDLTTPPPETPPVPDAFSYTFEVGDRSVTVPQQHLTEAQRALADLVLAFHR